MGLEDNWKTLKMASLGSMLSSRLKGCLPQVGPNMSLHPLRHFAISSMRSQRVWMILWLFDVIWYHLGNFSGLNHLILSDFQDIVMGCYGYFHVFSNILIPPAQEPLFRPGCSQCQAPECHKNPMKGTQRKAGRPAASSGYLWTDLGSKGQPAPTQSSQRSQHKSQEEYGTQLWKTSFEILECFGTFGTWVFWERSFFFRYSQWGSERRRGSWSRWRGQRWSLLSKGHCFFWGDAKSCEDNRMT